MKKPNAILILLGLAATAVAAGEEGRRCPEEASVCIRQMVERIENKGWIGIEIQTDEERPRIRRVLAGSPAEAAGLEAGDLLVALEGIAYSRENEAALHEAKKALVPGGRVTFTVERAGERLDVEIVPVKIPRHILTQWVGEHVLEHHMADAPQDESEAEAGSRP